MKRSAIFILLCLPTVMAFAGHSLANSPCDVKGVYRSIDVPIGAVALSSLGDVSEVEMVLVPAKLESGTYEVSVTRKGKDVYRVDGGSTYVITRYCYEYSYGQTAYLKYTSVGSAGTGTLTFGR